MGTSAVIPLHRLEQNNTRGYQVAEKSKHTYHSIFFEIIMKLIQCAAPRGHRSVQAQPMKKKSNKVKQRIETKSKDALQVAVGMCEKTVKVRVRCVERAGRGMDAELRGGRGGRGGHREDKSVRLNPHCCMPVLDQAREAPRNTCLADQRTESNRITQRGVTSRRKQAMRNDMTG